MNFEAKADKVPETNLQQKIVFEGNVKSAQSFKLLLISTQTQSNPIILVKSTFCSISSSLLTMRV
jgi:hypothetical protein